MRSGLIQLAGANWRKRSKAIAFAVVVVVVDADVAVCDWCKMAPSNKQLVMFSRGPVDISNGTTETKAPRKTSYPIYRVVNNALKSLLCFMSFYFGLNFGYRYRHPLRCCWLQSSFDAPSEPPERFRRPSRWNTSAQTRSSSPPDCLNDSLRDFQAELWRESADSLRLLGASFDWRCRCWCC